MAKINRIEHGVNSAVNFQVGEGHDMSLNHNRDIISRMVSWWHKDHRRHFVDGITEEGGDAVFMIDEHGRKVLFAIWAH